MRVDQRIFRIILGYLGVVLAAVTGVRLTLILDHSQVVAAWLRTSALGALGFNDYATALQILNTMATAAITLVAAAVSLSIVSLVLLSQQFAPRLLIRQVMDRRVHWTLSLFIGNTVASLVIMHAMDGSHIPSFSLYFDAFFFAASFFMFIKFYIDISQGINVSKIVTSIADEAVAQLPKVCEGQWDDHNATLSPPEDWVDELCDDRRCSGGIDPREPAIDGPPDSRAVLATTSGYLKNIHYDSMARLLDTELEAVFENCHVGQFVMKGTPIVFVRPAAAVSPRIDALVRQTYELDHYRTIDEDLAFGIRQIVDIAIKAISPAVNDPTTALNCIDYLAVILSELARWRPKTQRLRSPAGKVVYMKKLHFEALLALSFDQILYFGGEDPVVLKKLAWAIRQIAGACPAQVHLTELSQYLGHLEQRSGDDSRLEAPSLRDVRIEIDKACALLDHKLMQLARLRAV